MTDMDKRRILKMIDDLKMSLAISVDGFHERRERFREQVVKMMMAAGGEGIYWHLKEEIDFIDKIETKEDIETDKRLIKAREYWGSLGDQIEAGDILSGEILDLAAKVLKLLDHNQDLEASRSGTLKMFQVKAKRAYKAFMASVNKNKATR